MPFYDPRTKKWIGVFRKKGFAKETKSFLLKRGAKAWEAERKKEAKTRTQTGMGFVQFSEKYLDYVKAKYIGKTFKEKTKVIKDFLRFMGADLPVDSITPEHINDYLLAQVSERSANSANRDRKNLLSMWNWGQRILDLGNNPVAKLERFAHARSEQYVPSEQDILKILGVANRKERLFLLCYLHTAARRSEIFRLRWADDINFERKEIRLGTRKTKDGGMEYSWMPMTEELWTELNWWYSSRSATQKSGRVFLIEEGPYSGLPYTYRHKFLKGLCKRAEVQPFGFHALRRYAASILADKYKVSSKTIQRILRHKNLSTTELYIKRLNSDLRATVELLSGNDPSVISSVIFGAENNKKERE